MARSETPKRRCAIYTRKSSEEGLSQARSLSNLTGSSLPTTTSARAGSRRRGSGPRLLTASLT